VPSLLSRNLQKRASLRAIRSVTGLASYTVARRHDFKIQKVLPHFRILKSRRILLTLCEMTRLYFICFNQNRLKGKGIMEAGLKFNAERANESIFRIVLSSNWSASVFLNYSF
jgi:hypothetical protein